ncbi:hypothetical protein [Caldimonas brevitalea]|uniref:Bacteriophage-related protein n=1 Tax=Caldimonas brevitalea TaxID=413882 RepID=A0A0G3BTD6_9BURK|nr:hypothetical protein [Caldimonas brevitalea]AKJ30646.1 hypothetical protein AAW51_3955 [Caldimonas brevitalea]
MGDAVKPKGSARQAVTVEGAGSPRQHSTGVQSVTFVPLTIRRRHIRKVLTPPPGEGGAPAQPTFDLSMIKVLGKAFYWQRLLDSGEVQTTKELARQLKLDPGWIAEVLRLTLLAPDIVEAIFEGKQPRHLHLHLLRGREDLLPREWGRQRAVLGFATVTR